MNGRIKDITNQRFGNLTALKYVGSNKDKKAMWECKCDCGNTYVTTGKSLRLNLTTSCGCMKIQRAIQLGKKNKTHGKTKTRLYNIWHGMKKRCRTESDTNFKYYGGKGISVCDEWVNSFESFEDWSIKNGYSENLTLDRINPEGNYEPDNCRWADWVTQGNNRSNNVFIMFEGEEMTKAEAARKIGISSQLLQYRYDRGIPLRGKDDIE